MPILWSLKRVSGLGAMAGLLALALWPFSGLYGPVLLGLFLAAAALAGLCGAGILVITAWDIVHHPRRGSRIRPMRGFDLSLGLGLILLGGFELRDAIGLLPA